MTNRRNILLLAGTCVALGAAPLAAQGFEGVITMSTTTPNGSVPSKIYVKNDRSRVETTTPRGDMVTITDRPNKTSYMVMTAQQQYVQREIREGGMGGGANAPAAPEIVKTGKMDKVAGYDCEHWTIKTGQMGDMDACVAKGLGQFVGGGRGMGGMNRAFGDMFPLKVSGANGTMLEVTSIEKKSLGDDMFAPPAGFTKVDPPARQGGGGPPAR